MGDLPEMAFYMVGDINEAIAKAVSWQSKWLVSSFKCFDKFVRGILPVHTLPY